MLRTNLSTRPFYNERVVQLVLWAAALVIAGLTVFNIVELRLLSVRHGQLLGRVVGDEKRAAKLRADADAERRHVDRAQLETVAAAAREANDLIDRRTFSWTELLNRLEATIPAEVRIQAIRPATGRDGALSVSMVTVGRRAEDIEQFVEQLEGTGAFRNVYSRTETTNQQGLLEVVIEARYERTAAKAGAPTVEGPQPAQPAAPAPAAPAVPIKPGREE
jgi:type IV pilus assembly protein PilN